MNEIRKFTTCARGRCAKSHHQTKPPQTAAFFAPCALPICYRIDSYTRPAGVALEQSMMSEQINFNLNQCTKPPLTREYAEIAAERQRKNGNRVNVFYCTECAAYHTGSKHSHRPQPLRLITDTDHQFRNLGA